MILEIDGGAVIDSEHLDSQTVRDSEVRLDEDDGDVTVRSDGPVAITIRHEGVSERIID